MTETKKERNDKDQDFLVEFRKSIKFDRRLFYADIRISIAYCKALFDAGVLSRIEAERIRNGLQTVLKRADFNRNYFEESAAPNVHSFIEERLIQLIGDVGAKINIGRSRNEQTFTALRLWLREEIENVSKFIKSLQIAFIKSAENQKQAVLPVYEHSNKSQTILWAHWCLACFEMLARDRERLDEVWRRVNVLPLGSGNLAGTPFEIDREEVARQLGFEGVSNNSFDAASDFDFTIEFASVCALLSLHLSRLAADLTLYQTAEFGFIELSKILSNNSSLITKNPDVLEIVQAKVSNILGNQTMLLSLLKNSNVGVQNNLQEILKTVFDTIDTIKSSLETMRIVLENVSVNEEKTRLAAMSGYQNAAELFDYLVHRELPVKTAREVSRQIVSLANSKNKKISELSLEEMRQFSAVVGEDLYESLTLEQTLASKSQIGGTAPERVFEALDAAKEILEREEN